MNRNISDRALLTTLWGMSAEYGTHSKRKTLKKVKICLNGQCNNEHTHNNSFCSVECCKAHKACKHE